MLKIKAIVYEGINQVAVKEVKEPTIEKPDDAVVKITSTAICGSDLAFNPRHDSASDSKKYFDLSTPGKFYDENNLKNAKPPEFNIPNPSAPQQGQRLVQ